MLTEQSERLATLAVGEGTRMRIGRAYTLASMRGGQLFMAAALFPLRFFFSKDEGRRLVAMMIPVGLDQSAKLRSMAVDYGMAREVIASESGTRHETACSSGEAFEFQVLARRIVSEVRSPGSDAEKSVDVALMLRGATVLKSSRPQAAQGGA
jgi:hypothetical protein